MAEQDVWSIYTSDAGALHAMVETSGPVIKNGLQNGFNRGWLVGIEGRIVAGVGIMIIAHPVRKSGLQTHE